MSRNGGKEKYSIVNAQNRYQQKRKKCRNCVKVKRPCNSPFYGTMFLTTKTYLGGRYMTQVHFTLNNKEIQSIIEHSVKDDVSKNILTTIFSIKSKQKYKRV